MFCQYVLIEEGQNRCLLKEQRMKRVEEFDIPFDLDDEKKKIFICPQKNISRYISTGRNINLGTMVMKYICLPIVILCQ